MSEAKFFPRYGVWELTNRCNANCIHCGSESGDCREYELNEEEVMRTCEELAELGCESMGLIGGEFFFSPYWEKVTKKLRSLGVSVSHLTNGILLNDANIAKFLDLGVNAISVSIDGVGKTQDYIRGVPGLYEKVIENIKKAKKAGMRVGVNTTVSKLNLHEMQALFEVLTELEVNSWQLQGLEDFGRANENPELYMGAKDFYELVKQVAQWRKDTKIRLVLGDNIGHFVHFEPMLRDHPFSGCIAGRWNIGIESNGNIRACLSIRGDDNVLGNIRERSLKELWNDEEIFKAYRVKPMEKLTGFCAQCQFAQLCRGGCASQAISLTGDMYENPLCLHKYEVENGLWPEDES